jgi:hypothetical protein
MSSFEFDACLSFLLVCMSSCVAFLFPALSSVGQLRVLHDFLFCNHLKFYPPWRDCAWFRIVENMGDWKTRGQLWMKRKKATFRFKNNPDSSP